MGKVCEPLLHEFIALSFTFFLKEVPGLMCTDDGYGQIQVSEHKLATFGMGIAKQEEWIEELLTGQKRLADIG